VSFAVAEVEVVGWHVQPLSLKTVLVKTVSLQGKKEFISLILKIGIK